MDNVYGLVSSSWQQAKKVFFFKCHAAFEDWHRIQVIISNLWKNLIVENDKKGEVLVHIKLVGQFVFHGPFPISFCL